MLNDRARTLRKKSTEAEKYMWNSLRDRRLENFKFNRQFIIAPYIVDFICREKMLIIEIDGGHHNEQIEYDKERTYFLEAMGYQVLRFWNNEVITNHENVLEAILEALRPSPYPSPAKR
ncbi:MAG: endonuclease domain-containing protein [Gammaproteobacteria bacterium]|jgi:very-short-patch-repair endonuclease|nr:endonuclease domain-containing protein [Gammaproteobacteria bacterium]